MHQIMICLFIFDAQFFCLSAVQNAPQPAGGTFCTTDKQKNCASKVNQLAFGYMAVLQETAQARKG